MKQVHTSKKLASLVAVCLQSTILAVVLNVSNRRNSSTQQYKGSSAVICTEVAKLALSAALAALQIRSNPMATIEPTCPSSVQTIAERRESKSSSVEKQFPPPATTESYRRRSTFTAHRIHNNDTTRDYTTSSVNTAPGIQGEVCNTQIKTAVGPRSWLSTFWLVWRQTFGGGFYKMAIPALLFSIQNMLIYVAARNLSITVFQITFQLKSLITALCAVIMLGRRYTPAQWISLLVLGAGVAMIQLGPQSQQGQGATQHSDGSATRSLFVRLDHSQITGIAAVIVSCFASAVAATYFELVLKKKVSSPSEDGRPLYTPLPSTPPAGRLSIQLEASISPLDGSIGDAQDFYKLGGGRRHTVAFSSKLPTQSGLEGVTTEEQSVTPVESSLWIRNIQLALFSLVCTAVYNFSTSGSTITQLAQTFFEGFNVYTWIVIAIQAIGGLLTALVIKHADNVAKGFALSMSIVLTLVISIVYFDYHVSPITIMGGMMVVITSFTFERFGRK